MGQRVSRPAFEGLVTQNHVRYALVSRDGIHNAIPLVCIESMSCKGRPAAGRFAPTGDRRLTTPQILASIAHLNGSPEQLQRAYDAFKWSQEPWTMSPERIHSLEQRDAALTLTA